MLSYSLYFPSHYLTGKLVVLVSSYRYVSVH